MVLGNIHMAQEKAIILCVSVFTYTLDLVTSGYGATEDVTIPESLLNTIFLKRLQKTNTETKQNKTEQNKTKQNKTKQNKTKQNKTKLN